MNEFSFNVKQEILSAHKLKEWRDFCDVIQTLPYFNIIEASIGPAAHEKSKDSNEETQN